jgi:hypothetical protein
MVGSFLQRIAMTAGVSLLASSAMAGYSIEVQIDNVFFDIINDGDPEDLSPAVGDIWYHFVLNDPANRWQAEGDVFAEGGYDGVPPVSTIVTNTHIEKIANVPIFAGEIDFIHTYAASGLQMHTAHIDGQFDNTIDHEVKGASLDYFASVNDQSLGAFVTGIYVGPGPEPFVGDLGPMLFPTTTEHHMQLRFYLDSLGDSIDLFNSAEMHGFVPEPASSHFVLLAIVCVHVARGRRKTGERRRR